MTKDERRRHRRHVLVALNKETGSHGGGPAGDRVKAYIRDPERATTVEFAFVGALTLVRFFVDPSKPNQSERRSLWQAILDEFATDSVKDPGGWNGTTNVSQLQAIVEEALGLE
jgi:hypothetical protein